LFAAQLLFAFWEKTFFFWKIMTHLVFSGGKRKIVHNHRMKIVIGY
jgi:predicted metal-dependent enzyme (double-stranded beta helix superfamily)